MGSSKKKHKKNKEKNRDRERVHDKKKTKSTSSSSAAAAATSGNVYYETTTASSTDPALLYSVEQQSTDQSTVLRPLRLVLKVPSSAYSTQANETVAAVTTTTTTTAVESAIEISAITESPPVQLYQNDDEVQLLSPTNLTQVNAISNEPNSIELSNNIPENAFRPNDINSNMSENVFTPDDEALVGEQNTASGLQYVNSLFSHSSSKLLSKKVKKSKKSKKSKHHKHSHTHKNSHRKHHHRHSTSTLPAVDSTETLVNNYDSTQFDNNLSLTELQSHNLLNLIPDPNLTTSNSDLFHNVTKNDNATQFSAPDQPYVTSSPTQQNINFNSTNELDTKLNWFTTIKTTSPKTMVNSEESIAQNSYNISFSNNDLSQKPGTEIKLKLSKSSSSSQYTSNIKQSPNKQTYTSMATQIVPPLIISPSKTNSPFVGKSNLPVSAEVQKDSVFQINSKMPSITSNTDLELKMQNIEKPSYNIMKTSSNGHKRGKKKKSEKNFQDLLLYLLRQLTKKDSQHFFAKPVSDLIAPGYSTIIAHPMDLSTIGKNITSGHYRNLGDFQADVKLMCDNAMKYNRVETIYYKAASKLWHYTKNKLFKNSSLAEYAKTYVKCTPLDLSLNPTNPQPTSKHHSSSSVQFFSIPSFNTESTMKSSTSNSTNPFKSSPVRFEPTNVPVGFDGIAPMTSTTPFSLEPEPNNNPIEDKPKQIAPIIEPLKLTPVKKNIVCDGMTAEELVKSIKESARKASEALRQSKKRPPAYSILKQNSTTVNGAVTLQTLNTGDIPVSSKQTFVKNTNFNERMEFSLNDLIDNDKKLKQGDKIEIETNQTNKLETISTTMKQTLVSENNSKNINMIFADSSSDAQSKEMEIEKLRKKLIATYGDEISLDYALSVAKFAKGCEYSENLFNTLMGVLTGNEHRNVFEQFYQLVKLTTET